MTVQIALERRALPQPTPHVVPDGDCGACCLAGALGVSIEMAYSLAAADEHARRYGLSWPNMRQALCNAKARGLIDRLIDDVPIWPVWAGTATWGAPSWEMAYQWFGYVRMAIDAGYYGFAAVDHARGGPLVSGDHFVIICGAREKEVHHPAPRNATEIVPEILVSCSSASTSAEEWVEVESFLTRRGGYNVLLARPRIP